MKSLSLVCLVGLVALLSACGKKSESGEKQGGHVHTAPHGGTLVELGEHAYAVELLRDRTAGKLMVWILDAHAENFVRIKSPTIELVAMPGGKFTPLSLAAVANAATGETVGDTSQFEVQADWLKTADDFAGIITVEIRGTKFEKVGYEISK